MKNTIIFIQNSMRCFLKTLNFIFNTKKASSTLVLLTIWTFQLCANTQDSIKILTSIKELYNKKRYVEALSILDKIENQCIMSDNDTIKIFFYKYKGDLKLITQNYNEAILNLKQMQSLCESINFKDHTYIESFLSIGMAYQQIGNDSIAERYYRKGLIKNTCKDNPNEGINKSFFLNLGQIYKDQGKEILADKYFAQTTVKQSNLEGLTISQFYELLDNNEMQAINLRKIGEYEQSLRIYNNLIHLTKNIIDTNNEDYIRLVYSKALVLWVNLSRLEEAKVLFKEIFDIGLSYNECDENVLGSIARYLQILAYEGCIQDLDSYLPSAISIFSNCQKESSPVGLLYRLIGNGFNMAENYPQAISFYEKYMSEMPNEEGLSYLEIPNLLSICYIKTGNTNKAEFALNNLISNYKSDLDKNIDIKVSVFLNYGKTLMLNNKYKKAIPYLEEANKLYYNITGNYNIKITQYLEECKKQF